MHSSLIVLITTSSMEWWLVSTTIDFKIYKLLQKHLLGYSELELNQGQLLVYITGPVLAVGLVGVILSAPYRCFD